MANSFDANSFDEATAHKLVKNREWLKEVKEYIDEQAIRKHIREFDNKHPECFFDYMRDFNNHSISEIIEYMWDMHNLIADIKSRLPEGEIVEE